MRLKIVKYLVDDLVVDHKDIARNLNQICTDRSLKWEVCGICQKNETILISLNQVSFNGKEYLFAPVDCTSAETIEHDIQSHWQGGSSLMGVISINEDESLGLYFKENN